MAKTTATKSKGASPETPTPAEPTPAATPAAAAPRFAAAGMGKVRTAITAAIPANRSALLAAGLGFAVAAGLLAAALGAMGVGHLVAAPTPAPWTAAVEETRILKQTVAKLDAQVAGLKASVEAASRHADTRRVQSAERDQRSARTQAAVQARLVKIGDALDRLEKRAAAAAATDTTGSVAPQYAAAAAAAAAQPPATAAETPAKPPVVAGWVIRNVLRGRALVANRRGVFEAAPGLFLPELGRVEAVTRQNGRWVVVTEKGIITAMRRPRAATARPAD